MSVVKDGSTGRAQRWIYNYFPWNEGVVILNILPYAALWALTCVKGEAFVTRNGENSDPHTEHKTGLLESSGHSSYQKPACCISPIRALGSRALYQVPEIYLTSKYLAIKLHLNHICF